MNEGAQELTTKQLLPDIQRRAIIGIADIRRQTQTLSTELDLLTESSAYREVAGPLRSAYDGQYRLVMQTMQGITSQESNTSQVDSITTHLASAEQFQTVAPNLAAFHFAKAASMQQSAGVEFTQSLEKAKQCLEDSKKMGISRTTPSDFLPDAYILGIAKKASEGVKIPLSQEMAQIIQSDQSLLKDYALVLPESERGQFLSCFPENQQLQISLQMDRAVSEMLHRKHIVSATDIDQRETVKARVEKVFTKSLTALKTSAPDQQKGLDGRGIGDRWTSKQITETVVNLGEEDSLRLLRDLSEQTTSELKALNKKFKKMGQEDRRHALEPSLSFTARVLDALIDVDTKRGGVLAMRYLEMSALPDRLFTFFARKLIDKEYFTKNFSSFLSNPDNILIIKKIMSKYGQQFNTIIDTIAQIPDYNRGYQLAPNEKELFEALEDLTTLTPRIFSRYRSLPTEQRKVFAERIRRLKPQFFKNTPIKQILPASDRDILAEMVYMAYKPMQMSFGQVEKLIEKVDDHTEDLSRYVFPEDGYPLVLERSAKYMLKEQQQVDLSAIRRYRDLFSPITVSEPSQKIPSFVQAVHEFLQQKVQDEEIDKFDRNTDNNLKVILQPFQAQSRVREFLDRYREISPDNAFQTENELAEITGVYFHDNYARVLTEYLGSHPDELQRIVTLVSDASIRNSINERLKQFNEVFDWQMLDRTIQLPERGILNRFLSRPQSSETQPLMAKLLTLLVEHKHIEPMRKHIQNELSKFTLSSEESSSSSYRGALKAYISKNVGSFFAKAAAGICTAEDIPLFERTDHFHINIVENDETVRANIQAYITRVEGKPSLVLRGFNPTADWVGKIDIESFCEQILTIGRQFQGDNGLGGIYITEQSGGWHALSNRTQVASYLMKKYEEGKTAVPLPLQVASSHTIQTVYHV